MSTVSSGAGRRPPERPRDPFQGVPPMEPSAPMEPCSHDPAAVGQPVRRLYRLAKAAAAVGVTEDVLRLAVERGELRAVVLRRSQGRGREALRRVYVTAAALERWLASRPTGVPDRGTAA